MMNRIRDSFCMLKSTPMLAAGDLNKLVVLLQVNVHDYDSFGLKEFCKKKRIPSL
jgi:hypothetical protein